MGRSPGCFFAKDDDDQGLNRGAWTATEDKILSEYIKTHGVGPWRSLPKKSGEPQICNNGLKRCRKSCRLRWLNYLRPDIKRGNISPEEEELLIRLHRLLGNRYALKDIIRYLNLYYRWSLIAGRLPGRTDNEIKNYWKTHFSRVEMGEFESTFQKPLQRRDVPYPDYDVESVVDKDNHTSQSTAIITTAVGYCAREVADIDNLDSYNNNHVVDTNDHDHVINQEENLKSAGDQVVEIDISKSWCQLLLDCLGDHQYDQLELVNCFQSNDITNSSYGTDHEHNQSPSLSP